MQVLIERCDCVQFFLHEDGFDGRNANTPKTIAVGKREISPNFSQRAFLLVTRSFLSMDLKISYSNFRLANNSTPPPHLRKNSDNSGPLLEPAAGAMPAFFGHRCGYQALARFVAEMASSLITKTKRRSCCLTWLRFVISSGYFLWSLTPLIIAWATITVRAGDALGDGLD